MEPITLQWHGPFSLRRSAAGAVFDAAIASEAGIYLWTVPTDQGPLVQYVGETGKTFRARHLEHLASYHSGAYSINKAEALKQGRLEPAYRGFLYSRRRRAEREPGFIANRVDLLAEVAKTLEILELFLAPFQAEQRLRRRVETAIVRQLQSAGGQEAAFLDEGLATWERRVDEVPVPVHLTEPPRFRGLSRAFEA